MEKTHKYYDAIENNVKYSELKKNPDFKIPKTETLKTVIDRVVSYWKENIVPRIKNGETILIVAHGTVLRALVKFLNSKYFINAHELSNIT